MMSPVFDEFSDKYAGKCLFVKVDVDKSEVRCRNAALWRRSLRTLDTAATCSAAHSRLP